MERMIASDAVRIIQSSIQKGVPVQFGNVQIYADRLIVEVKPPDTGADTRLILSRVVAAKLNRAGQIVWDAAARQAVVDVHRREGQTYLKLALVDTVGFDAGTGQLAAAAQIEPDPIVIPSAFHDDPQFMTQYQLLRLRERPDEFSHVVDAKKRVAEALRSVDVSRHIGEALKAHGRVELTATWGGRDRRLLIEAQHFVGGRFSNSGGRPVSIVDFEGGRPVRRIIAERATVRRAANATIAEPTLDLALRNCEVFDLRGEGTVNRRQDLPIPNLSLEGLDPDDPSQLPHEELRQLAGEVGGVAQDRAASMTVVIDRLQRAIVSRLLRRYALSVTAALLLLLGAMLAIWLRHSVPLIIYVWAFLPSVLDILLISSGDHMARGGQLLAGIGIMWSGNVLMAGMLVFVFLKLSRH
jgi:hypothetical protein